MRQWRDTLSEGRNDPLDMCALRRGYLTDDVDDERQEHRDREQRVREKRDEEGCALIAAAFPGRLAYLRPVAWLRLVAQLSMSKGAKALGITRKRFRVASRHVAEQMEALREDGAFWEAYALRGAYERLVDRDTSHRSGREAQCRRRPPRRCEQALSEQQTLPW